MSKVRNHVIAVALLTLAAASILVYPGQSVAQGTHPGQGSAPVTIVGPLPLPVVGPQAPAFEPLTHQFRMSFVQPGDERDDYIVPADKRLVIETVSARGSVPQGEAIDFDLFVNKDGGLAVGYVFQPQFVGTFGTFDRFEAMHAVRIYVEPGSLVQAVAQKNGNTIVGSASVSISGHFENVK
jgi:hypothetical protein